MPAGTLQVLNAAYGAALNYGIRCKPFDRWDPKLLCVYAIVGRLTRA